MSWKLWSERQLHNIQNDANYLVSYMDDEGHYCVPHRAYYAEYIDKMLLLDSLSSFPISCDIYMEMPEVPK
jgi:hypothetical protein